MPYSAPPQELNDRNGDIVLRSSDQVRFRVFRWPLQRLYPVFSDMFHLPEPAAASPQGPSVPPTVQMCETAVVIEALLRLSYPIDPPIVKNLRTMTAVTEALIKLQAEQRCKWWIRMTAERFIRENPWAVYAILLALGRKSCSYNFEEEIRLAARETVGRPVIRPWEEACLITAADYERLLEYHAECRNAFLGTQEKVWEKAGTRWPWFNGHCSGITIVVGNSCVTIAPWFPCFRSRAKKALSNGLRGEDVEDMNLWYDLLDKDREAKKLCSACAKSSALQLPAYAKLLAKLSEEAFSKVSRSSTRLRRVECRYLAVRRNLPLYGKLLGLPLNHLSS